MFYFFWLCYVRHCSLNLPTAVLSPPFSRLSQFAFMSTAKVHPDGVRINEANARPRENWRAAPGLCRRRRWEVFLRPLSPLSALGLWRCRRRRPELRLELGHLFLLLVALLAPALLAPRPASSALLLGPLPLALPDSLVRLVLVQGGPGLALVLPHALEDSRLFVHELLPPAREELNRLV